MASDPYTKTQRAILNYLEGEDQKVNRDGMKPPILVQTEVILSSVPGAAAVDLHELEILGILTHDQHLGKRYFGFHPAIIGMPGDHGTTYTIDPDLVCEHCGKPQSTSCLMGDCT